MTWTRRKFVVTSATLVAGAVLARHSAGLRLTSEAHGRLKLIRSHAGGRPSGFERGIQAPADAAGVGLEMLELPRRIGAAGWRDLSASLRGTAVLGLVTQSEFVLVNELIRDSGARLLHQGDHVVDGSGLARHASTTGAASVGVDGWLSRARDAWPEALGVALGRVALQQWDPAAMPPLVSPRPGIVPHSSFVSFVFAG